MPRTITTYSPARPGTTLYDIFSCLHGEPYAVFLDSSQEGHYSRYSIAGFLPEKIIRADDTVNDTSMEELRAYLKAHKEANPTALPFVNGAIGYLTYDYGKKFMGLPHVHPRHIDMPECLFIFYKLYLIEDKETGMITLSAESPLALQWFYDREVLSMGFKNPYFDVKKGYNAELSEDSRVSSDFEKDDYQNAIARMVQYIVEGDIYITNMTRQLSAHAKADPYDVFRALRLNNPSPFGGYFNYNDFHIISASPERFFELRDGIIKTRPIKGTRRRGSTPEEDELLRLELENSSKDQSELLMIVDLERNDLSRFCKNNSVKVEELFVTEAYATVFHLVSTIRGEVEDGKDIVDVLRAMFPGGSITGAPKYRSMEIIDELEHSRRMLYTGSIGYIGTDGNADFNIVIRTLVHQNDCFTMGAGGGITCESETEFEYIETSQKAAAPIRAVLESASKNHEI